MKNKALLLLTIGAAFVGQVAYATAVPVTDFYPYSAKVSADYSFAHTVGGAKDVKNGYGVALEGALTDRLALQYSYHKTRIAGPDLENQQVNAVWRYNHDVNFFGGITYTDVASNYFGFHAGVIGHRPLTEQIKGFAKLGVGDDVKYSMQIGGTYEIKDGLDLNLYYEYNKYGVKRFDHHESGLHLGLGYSF